MNGRDMDGRTTGRPDTTAARARDEHPAQGRDERLAQAKKAAREEADRRRERSVAPERPKELDGRGGEEPTRYGDWEVKGLASDF